MKLRAGATGLAAGALFGGVIFLGTCFSMAFGSGQSFKLYSDLFPFLQRNPLGLLTGTASGLAGGFLMGVLFAWLYNAFCGLLYRPKQ
jgi:hypothetical protein